MKTRIKGAVVVCAVLVGLSGIIRLATPGPDRIKPWWWNVPEAEYQRAVREHQSLADWKAQDSLSQWENAPH